jgi:hypothetical protein
MERRENTVCLDLASIILGKDFWQSVLAALWKRAGTEEHVTVLLHDLDWEIRDFR